FADRAHDGYPAGSDVPGQLSAPSGEESRLWFPDRPRGGRRCAPPTTGAEDICYVRQKLNTWRAPDRTARLRLPPRRQRCCLQGRPRACWPEFEKSWRKFCRTCPRMSVTDEHWNRTHRKIGSSGDLKSLNRRVPELAVEE